MILSLNDASVTVTDNQTLNLKHYDIFDFTFAMKGLCGHFSPFNNTKADGVKIHKIKFSKDFPRKHSLMYIEVSSLPTLLILPSSYGFKFEVISDNLSTKARIYPHMKSNIEQMRLIYKENFKDITYD